MSCQDPQALPPRLRKSSSMTPNSTNPPSPSKLSIQSQDRHITTRDVIPPYGTLAQLTFAPTTQTTVVTTTTTTTTAFPPFVMNPPKHLEGRDPEVYPLALTPTPKSIRQIHMKLGGTDTFFQETDEADRRLEEYNAEQKILRAHDGKLETVKNTNSFGDATQARLETGIGAEPKEGLHNGSINRSATPVSLSDAAELSSLHRRNKRPTKIAPYLKRKTSHPLRQNQLYGITSDSDTYDNFPQTSDEESSSFPNDPSTGNPSFEAEVQDRFQPENQRPSIDSQLRGSQSVAGSATPPVTESDYDPFRAPRIGPENRRRSLLPLPLETTSPLQEGSLPSPSLSPITAAATLHSSNALLNTQRQISSEISEDTETVTNSDRGRLLGLPAQLKLPEPQVSSSLPGLPTPSFTDLPGMLDAFDSMPEALKTWTMYQFLRRCSKSTLRFVADSVDPALRSDFLARLPLELSLHVLQYLDAKSMCQAAQVSKKWRRIVDSDERAWKNLIDADGFTLPAGEIDRAVKEGWGWQFPSRAIDWEHDIDDVTFADLNASISIAGQSLTSDDGVAHLTSTLHTSPKRKRKATTRSSNSKKQKRKMTTRTQTQSSPPWQQFLYSATGPIAYASAAAAAVPNPNIGLRSLRNLHLFKSIYQRHHLIRQSWMKPETKPLHLAFRAHQRHVVTCLQFDSKKILTGSDDANIDIYDTETGASLKKLEGHEGGVWALEYQGNILVSGSTDRSVRVWDMEEGRCLQVFQGHTSTVRCLQILQPIKVGESADGSPIMEPKQPLIITGSRDSTCRVWRLPKLGDRSIFQAGPAANDYDNPYFVRTLTGHAHSVRAIAAYADTLVSGSYDATVRVWRISTGETIHRLTGHTTKVYSVVLDHARGRCISGSMDNLVKVWSLETGSCMFTLEGHTSLVGLLDLKDDCLVSAAADATLRVWDPETGRCRHTLSQHTGAITCFAHDGQKVISGSDRTLKMWNTKTGAFVRDLLTDLSGVWQIKFDDRRCIAAVQRNNWTYIEVLDFGASSDGVKESLRGRRRVVNQAGQEILDEMDIPVDADIAPVQA